MNDPMVYVRRAQLVQVDVDRLAMEGEQAAQDGDLERARACKREIGVQHLRLLDIRREQLLAMSAPPERKRPWWRFWR